MLPRKEIYATSALFHAEDPPTKCTDELYSAFRGPAMNTMCNRRFELNNRVIWEEIKPYNKHEPLYLYHGSRNCLPKCNNDGNSESRANTFFKTKTEFKDTSKYNYELNDESRMRRRLQDIVSFDGINKPGKMLAVDNKNEKKDALKCADNNFRSQKILKQEKSKKTVLKPNEADARTKNNQLSKSSKPTQSIKSTPTLENKKTFRMNEKHTKVLPPTGNTRNLYKTNVSDESLKQENKLKLQLQYFKEPSNTHKTNIFKSIATININGNKTKNSLCHTQVLPKSIHEKGIYSLHNSYTRNSKTIKDQKLQGVSALNKNIKKLPKERLEKFETTTN